MSPRLEQRFRLGLWVLLILGWVVAVWMMWEALTTVPGAERLETSRLVAIPTPRTFFAAAAFAGLELAVVLAILWPWREDFYATRLLAAALALVTWFIMTTPLQLSRMDWVHRRWLAGMAMTVALALVLFLLYRGARRFVPEAEGG
ncbi:MAG TPA: hypothetical protein VMM12_04590 [Longimicrobiales bacterium]|nr:hypothetical protein [Longimicrobiales bacterium]